MIRLNAFIQTDNENREKVLELAKKLVAASIKDAGCVAYDIFESATRKDVLMICETWEDSESLAIHSTAPHFTEIVPQLRSLAKMKTEKFIF